MAVTVQFESVVTEMYQEAFVGSSLENGVTLITFDLRKLDFQEELGTRSLICWRKDSYQVDVHELSTFHNPIKYRFILAQGYYLDRTNQRRYFTPEIKGVSTSQHMSNSSIRLACYLAVVCGVSLRHIALLFSVPFLLPITKSSVKRWIDDIGTHLPTPEEILQRLLAITPATECPIDGYDPRGTDNCVMVIKDEHARILMTHEAASKNGEDAQQFLKTVKKLGLPVTAAFSDYSQSFTEAIKAVYPQARFQADHFHTVKISGATSKNRCCPIADKSRRGEKTRRTRRYWTAPSSYGNSGGVSSRSQPIYRGKNSTPLPSWNARMRGSCTASVRLSANW